jgi:coproporphyrinogen III oxidase-like Fe-S oxidoreductase
VRHGFLRIDDQGLQVSATGRLFIRNICMTFDRHLRKAHAAAPVFSRTV